MENKFFYIAIMSLFFINLVSAAHDLPTDLVTDDVGLIEGSAIWANNVTNSTFWTMMLLGFCIVLFIAASRYSSDKAFGYAGTTGLFGALMLATLNLMSWAIASMFIIVGVVSIVTMIVSKYR